MPWWFISCIGAALCAVTVEYLNRIGMGGGGFLRTLMFTGVPILALQFCLYYGWRYAPHTLVAATTFSAGTAAMRLLMVKFALGEKVVLAQVIVAFMVVGCGFIMKEVSR